MKIGAENVSARESDVLLVKHRMPIKIEASKKKLNCTAFQINH